MFKWFPRSIDRGLIEAFTSTPQELNVGGFRDQLIAASLKRELNVRVEVQNFLCFRDKLIAASLKPYLASPAGCCAPRFRDQLIAASLKH